MVYDRIMVYEMPRQRKKEVTPATSATNVQWVPGMREILDVELRTFTVMKNVLNAALLVFSRQTNDVKVAAINEVWDADHGTPIRVPPVEKLKSDVDLVVGDVDSAKDAKPKRQDNPSGNRKSG